MEYLAAEAKEKRKLKWEKEHKRERALTFLFFFSPIPLSAGGAAGQRETCHTSQSLSPSAVLHNLK